jgi:hypothetical protein
VPSSYALSLFVVMEAPANKNGLFWTMACFKNKPLFVAHRWPINVLLAGVSMTEKKEYKRKKDILWHVFVSMQIQFFDDLNVKFE